MTKFHQVFVKAFADGSESHDGEAKHDEWFQVSCQTEEDFTSAEDVVASFKERQWSSVHDRHKEFFHAEEGVNWKHITVNV